MSTTAFIQVNKDINLNRIEENCLVKRQDGYPLGIAVNLYEALQHTYTLNGLNDKIPIENALICANPSDLKMAEKVHNPKEYYGAEHVYTIDSGCMTINHENIEEFVNAHLPRINQYQKEENEPLWLPLKRITVEKEHGYSDSFIVNRELAEGLLNYYEEKRQRIIEANPTNFTDNPNFIHYQNSVEKLTEAVVDYEKMAATWVVFNDSTMEGYEYMSDERIIEYAQNIIEVNLDDSVHFNLHYFDLMYPKDEPTYDESKVNLAVRLVQDYMGEEVQTKEEFEQANEAHLEDGYEMGL